MADTGKTPHSQLCKSRSDLTAWHNELSTSLSTMNVVWLEHFTSLPHLVRFDLFLAKYCQIYMLMTGKIGLIAQLFFRSYQICTTDWKLRSYFGL